ncbi:hypothetical protein [Cutibacterium avidum]|uniref:hypothetical protein n=1 Tax=Cutibacterium avidum TaxID=33010 RepID=UPI0008F5AC0F|nr:hypothetical protein [Cutibacterium avidum]MDK7698095.1 hypothetical protein [Cutibacterium avidum]OIJ79822.1 hypothetical protein APY06_10875 [Cutibacterium avidum]
MDITKLVIEALVFLAIGAGVSLVAWLIVDNTHHWAPKTSMVGGVLASTAGAFIITEAWTQLIRPERFAQSTLVLCAASALIATLAQARSRHDERASEPR